MLPRKFTVLDKDRIVKHLLSLKDEDRRLRFGGVVTDAFIEHYVHSSFNDDSKWIGCEDGDEIVSACHVAVYKGVGELGCSVNKEYRDQKLAQAMFDRAILWLRTQGITAVYMHCLSENGAMKHIARKNDMTVVSDHGESDANVSVAKASPFTPMMDVYADRMAIYDMVYKSNLMAWQKIVERLHT